MTTQILHQSFSIPGRSGLPVRGDLRRREDRAGAPVIVVCHGFKGFKDWGFFPSLGADLAQAGFVAVTFNFTGSGIGARPEEMDEIEQFERATLSGDLEDLDRVLEAVATDRLPTGPTAGAAVGLIGHSRGGGVALVRAAEDARIACLVTWAGVATFDRFTPAQIAEWRRAGFFEIQNARTGQLFRLSLDLLDDLERNRSRFDLLAAARRLACPYLIVHGTADETVPLAEAERLAAAVERPTVRLEVIAGAGHTFAAVHPFAGRTPVLEEALASTVEFFRQHLPA